MCFREWVLRFNFYRLVVWRYRCWLLHPSCGLVNRYFFFYSLPMLFLWCWWHNPWQFGHLIAALPLWVLLHCLNILDRRWVERLNWWLYEYFWEKECAIQYLCIFMFTSCVLVKINHYPLSVFMGCKPTSDLDIIRSSNLYVLGVDSFFWGMSVPSNILGWRVRRVGDI